MAGPWERFAAPQSEQPRPAQGDGPWSRFAEPAPQPAPSETNAVPGEGTGALPFAYRGVASVLGAPVDLANLALRYTGLPVSQTPVGGSASIENLLRRYGEAIERPMVPSPGARAETGPEYIGRGVGEAAGMLIPGFGLAQRLSSSARPLVSRVAQSVAQAPARAPVATVGGEVLSGAMAGAGRGVAEQAYPGDEAAGLIGEIVGGLTPSAVASLPRLAAMTPGARVVAGAVTPFTEAGSEIRAGRRLASLVAEPEAAARAAEQPTISELTPAQRTQEERLLSLERSIAENDPVIAQTLRDRAETAQETLLEEARRLGGDPAQTRAFLNARRQRLEDALAVRVEQARTRANARIAELEPNMPAEEASRIVREEFDKAYDAARIQENQLWRSIPQDVLIDTTPLATRYDEIVQNTPRTQQQDIPEYARRFLNPDADGVRAIQSVETPAELQGFRSELLDIERRARDAGQRNQARLARELADATLDAMNALPETGGAYDVARNFSRNLNQTFRQGPAGRLTETTSGEARIDPELTLQRIIGTGRVPGGVGERSLMEAVGESPAARTAVEDYLTRSLRDRVVTSEGRLRPEAATSWIRQNEALLERYPGIRDRLNEAIAAQQRADDLARRQGVSTRELRSPAESPIARFLGGDPENAVSRVFSAENPAEVAIALRRSAARDESGAALAGLRGAFVEDLLSRSRSVTPDGEVFRGSVIMDTLNNPRQRAALEAVFNPEEMQRLRQIGTEFTALERARKAGSLGAPMQDAPSKLIETFGRIAAARVGAAISAGGGMAGGLQSAQLASSRAKEFLGSLTNDRAARLLSRAVTDPDLFAALMRQMGSPRLEETAVRRLQGWMAGPAGRAFFLEESENSPGGLNDVQNIYNTIVNRGSNMQFSNSLLESRQLRDRVGRIFESEPQQQLFMSALRREAQLFHRANRIGTQPSVEIGDWNRSLTNLVTTALGSGQISDDIARRASQMLMSNEPRQVAAAIRLIENAASRRRQ